MNLLLTLILPLMAGVPLISALPGDGDAEGAKPLRLETAELQLRHALEQKLAMRGSRGRERMERRWRAVRAYQAVRTHFPGRDQIAAEAAFRAGELLRAGGEDDEALVEFKVARELCRKGPFAARSALEIGHVERRAGRAGGALDAYLDVVSDLSATQGARDDAAIWAGRVWFDSGRPDEARRWWERVARGAEDPVDRVRAHDELALALIDDGDLEGAAGMLERCRVALADVALEETRSGERVRNALTRMRAIAELKRAIAQRRDGVRIDRRARATKKN